jgi:hypothetical protein
VSGIGEISDQNPEKEHAVRLLLGAIRALPERDQDTVLALLLQGLTSNDAWKAAVHRGDERRRTAVAALGSIEMRLGGLTTHQAGSTSESDVKVVPIRFPAGRYEQLKAWSEEHNFPMAAVVRGLVDRFLDSQGLP